MEGKLFTLLHLRTASALRQIMLVCIAARSDKHADDEI